MNGDDQYGRTARERVTRAVQRQEFCPLHIDLDEVRMPTGANRINGCHRDGTSLAADVVSERIVESLIGGGVRMKREAHVIQPVPYRRFGHLHVATVIPLEMRSQ